jgi:Raf kinase inhibitor-like YbhB/YbcL family protein
MATNPRRAPAVAVGIAAVLALTACDTGDGKTLRDTVVPTTLPPPDTAPLDSATLDAALDDGSAAILPGAETTQPLDIPTEIGDGPMELIGPWNDGAQIDGLNTCDGEDRSPAFSWIDLPPGTAELALAVVDESATDGDGPFVHWVIAGIDPDAISLAEGAVPVGAIQATNSFGTVGWGGPCSPVGDEPHVYRFTLHALGQQVELDDGVPASEMLTYLDELTISTAALTGTYAR